jgi:hypothetical protein
LTFIKQLISLVFVITVILQPVHAASNFISQEADSSEIEVRQPSQEKLAGYTSDKAFDYSQETAEPESITSKILNWLFSWLSDLFANETTADVFKIAAYIFFISILILLVNQYFRGNLNSMLKRNRSRNGLQVAVEGGTLHPDDLDDLIQETIEQNRYREAICHLYRKTLRQLAEAELILWKKDKTNRDYLYELSSGKMRSLFSDVTRYYEYAEYGHFPVDQKLFSTVHQNFQQLNDLISDNR